MCKLTGGTDLSMFERCILCLPRQHFKDAKPSFICPTGAGLVDLASAFAARFPKKPSWLLQAHDFKKKIYQHFQDSCKLLKALRASEIMSIDQRLKVFILLSFIALVRIQLLAHVLATRWTSSMFFPGHSQSFSRLIGYNSLSTIYVICKSNIYSI